MKTSKLIFFVMVSVLSLNEVQRGGLVAVLEFYNYQPELQPNRITDNEVKKKRRLAFRQPELLLIANKKMRIICEPAYQ